MPPPSPVTPEEQTDSRSQNGAATSASLLAGLTEALRFLLPIGKRDHERRPEDVANFVAWIVPIGLLIGLLWVGGFRLSWKIYGEAERMRVIPSLSVILIECLITGPFLVLGLARTIHVLAGDHPLQPETNRLAPLSQVGTLVMCLTILSQYVLILSVDNSSPWWPSPDDWRHHFNFLYPRPIYRPLLLAPIWGRWGILLAATIGRTGRHADAETVALNRAMKPSRLLIHALLPIVLTAIYCSRSRNFLIGVIIGMMVFGITYVVTVAMARRGGGQTRYTLFAAGQVSQLAFLAVYRAFGLLIRG